MYVHSLWLYIRRGAWYINIKMYVVNILTGLINFLKNLSHKYMLIHITTYALIAVTGFFNWPNPSSCTMALASTRPLTEMSSRIFMGFTRRNFSRRFSRRMWEPRHLTTLFASTASFRDSFTSYAFVLQTPWNFNGRQMYFNIYIFRYSFYMCHWTSVNAVYCYVME
jgi:hypothetical protein